MITRLVSLVRLVRRAPWREILQDGGVAAVALGVGMVFIPAGVVVAGLGAILLANLG